MAEELVNTLVEALRQFQIVQQPTQPAGRYDGHGFQLQPYDENEEAFDNYISRLENFFNLRNITGDDNESNKRKLQILLHSLSPRVFQTLTTLTAPQKPEEKHYEELVTLLKGHLCPKASEMAEQHHFVHRLQGEDESIGQYVSGLREIANRCNFVCTTCNSSTMDVHLRSQFVRGIRDNDIREKLLQQVSTITFNETVKIAIATEAAKLESRQMQNQVRQSTSEINKISSSSINNSPDVSLKEKLKKLQGCCFRCGSSSHKSNECKAKDRTCHICRKVGHIGKVCLSNSKYSGRREQKQLNSSQSSSPSRRPNDEDIFCMRQYKGSRNDKMMIGVTVDDKCINLELDTGAAVTTMSLDTFQQLFPHKTLKSTNLKLHTYTNEVIEPIGVCQVKIKYGSTTVTGDLYVLAQKVDSIMGREWIRKINISWADIRSLRAAQPTFSRHSLDNFLKDFSDVFNNKVGKIPNFKCTLQLKEHVKPVFKRARPVPYAMTEKVENELRRLEAEGVIEKVSHAKWATPIVPILKPNGSIRICADYKATLNPLLQDEHYPVPRIEDIFAHMSGGKFFCTLDVRQAYLHVVMDEESSKMQAINTHLGIFKVNRLMFGIKTAPAIWQKQMDQVLQGLEGVSCFYDDVKVQGSTFSETLNRLKAVFERLRSYGIRLNKEKCKFFEKSIKYLGHVIDEKGLHKDSDKTKAITEAKRPTNIAELRTFLGFANYYNKFIPNLASILQPLYQLLQKNNKFKWTQQCENAFSRVKRYITSEQVLVPFNPKLPLILSTDASPFGIGAVLSHKMPDGSERPISFASRSLSKSEANYSQIEKEATGLFWGLHKFFMYCYGRPFTLVTDHQPLTSIFNPSKALPALSASRMLRYAIYLSGFNFKIEYRNTKHHANADYLSRFPKDEPEGDNLDEASQFQIHQLEVMPVTRRELAEATKNDPELTAIITSITQGNRLNKTEESLYSIQDGCVFRGERVAIPKRYRKTILDELHSAHIGMTKMKALARSYCWWPTIDKDIEQRVRGCLPCCEKQNNPSKTIHPWDYPSTPWQRIHVDYAGPFKNLYFLIVVDAYSKWVEVVPVNTMTSQRTITELRIIFSRFGLPLTVVTDNGTSFTSNDFQTFLKLNGITHKRTAPYHPSSNGQVERYVQVVKKGLKAMSTEPGDIQLKLCRLLLQYRRAPHTGTGLSPSELLVGRRIRTKLDMLIENKANETKESKGTRKSFNVGDWVQFRNFTNKFEKWKYGKIVETDGYLHYWIESEGKRERRHVDQIRSTQGNVQGMNLKKVQPKLLGWPVYTDHDGITQSQPEPPQFVETQPGPEPEQTQPVELPPEQPQQNELQQDKPQPETPQQNEHQPETLQAQQPCRRSTRLIKPNQCYCKF